MNEYGLKKEIKDAMKDLGFVDFTEIQKEIIPKVLNGESLVGQSKTGSGKSHAFLIPIFQNLDFQQKNVQAIICAPTRELALQIKKMADQMASFFKEKIDIRIYTGGTDRLKEIDKLKETQPMIVIGTPGKLVDLAIKENLLKIHTAKTIVIDEADMSFEIGFLEDLDKIASTLNNPQMLIFSATVKEAIRPFIYKYIKSKEHIEIKDDNSLIKHILIKLKGRERNRVLLMVLKLINPYLALIFTNTKETAINLSSFLSDNHYKVITLHGGLNLRERKRIMQDIHNLKYQYIVASDIASRGIDIKGVSHVINYEMPKDFEFYVHRTGRTGRAGLEGISISLGDFEDDEYLKKLNAKGIEFIYQNITNDGFVMVKEDREKRIKPIKDNVKIASSIIKKQNKVTPGYKKKREVKIARLAKKIRRKD